MRVANAADILLSAAGSDTNIGQPTLPSDSRRLVPPGGSTPVGTNAASTLPTVIIVSAERVSAASAMLAKYDVSTSPPRSALVTNACALAPVDGIATLAPRRSRMLPTDDFAISCHDALPLPPRSADARIVYGRPLAAAYGASTIANWISPFLAALANALALEYTLPVTLLPLAALER